MPKFKRQLVPGDYLTSADMLDVLSQQQLSAAALQGCIMLAAQPAMAWLLDCCCIGKPVSAETPVLGSNGSSTAATAAFAVPTVLEVTAKTAGVNVACTELLAQYRLSLQEAAARRQRRTRKGGGTAGGSSMMPSTVAVLPEAAASAPAVVVLSSNPSVQQRQQEQEQEQEQQRQRQLEQQQGDIPTVASAMLQAQSVRAAGTPNAAPLGNDKDHRAAAAAAAAAAAGIDHGNSKSGLQELPAAVAAAAASNNDFSSITCDSAASGLQLVQLSFQEAFFLASVLHCCQVVLTDKPAHSNLTATMQQQQQQQDQEQQQQGQEQQQQGQALQGPRQLSVPELWRWCCDSSAGGAVAFVPRYAAYLHFRSKGWIPQPGLNFGADYVLYELHPEFVHSDYAVSVMLEVAQPSSPSAPTAPDPSDSAQHPTGSSLKITQICPSMTGKVCCPQAMELDGGDDQQQQQQPSGSGCTYSSTQLLWLDAHIMQRLTRQVLKQLLLFYVVVPQGLDLTNPECMRHLAVREVLMQRWQPSAANNRLFLK